MPSLTSTLINTEHIFMSDLSRLQDFFLFFIFLYFLFITLFKIYLYYLFIFCSDHSYEDKFVKNEELWFQNLLYSVSSNTRKFFKIIDVFIRVDKHYRYVHRFIMYVFLNNKIFCPLTTLDGFLNQRATVV